MKQDIFFISVTYLKENTSINGNVDAEVLQPHILLGQRVHIERITGTDLYRKLQNDISGGTVTGNYKILLDDYIAPALAQMTYYEALPFIQFKMTNKSVMKKGSDNSTAVDLDELKYLRQGVRDLGEYLMQRISDYLLANQNLFPELLSNSDLDDIQPKFDNYFYGVYLGPSGIDDCDRFVDDPSNKR